MPQGSVSGAGMSSQVPPLFSVIFVLVIWYGSPPTDSQLESSTRLATYAPGVPCSCWISGRPWPATTCMLLSEKMDL